MPPLLTLKSTPTPPKGFSDRLTVKAVVINSNNEVCLFSGLLLGGGVEEGEELQDALKRECLEEAGLQIDIIKELGIAEQYRDALQKHYIVHGFLAKLVSVDAPTSTQQDELNRSLEWLPIDKAMQLLQQNIASIEAGKYGLEGDTYQGKLYNSKTSLTFLNEVRKHLAKVKD